jgi:hypothetical protein
MTDWLTPDDVDVPHLLTEHRAATDELQRLRAWKAEAIEVIGSWEQVWEALGRPGRLGESKAAAVLRAVGAADDRTVRAAALQAATTWLAGVDPYPLGANFVLETAGRFEKWIRGDSHRSGLPGLVAERPRTASEGVFGYDEAGRDGARLRTPQSERGDDQ